MTNDKLQFLGKQLVAYCDKFDIPIEYVFQILEDQKVTPMIRGKAMEYNAYLLLKRNLNKDVWIVEKLNLNAQTGTHDEDVSIKHRRTGIVLKVESKSAVRGKINDGKKSRKIKAPHFQVKCHRSRSNIKLAGTSNDRYHVNSFDVIITNTSNAIFQGRTTGEFLEVIHDKRIRGMLYGFYGVKNDDDLIFACYKDWRFCIPADIAERSYIPRTPYVLLNNDPSWRPIAELENRLEIIIAEKWRKMKKN